MFHQVMSPKVMYPTKKQHQGPRHRRCSLPDLSFHGRVRDMSGSSTTSETTSEGGHCRHRQKSDRTFAWTAATTKSLHPWFSTQKPSLLRHPLLPTAQPRPTGQIHGAPRPAASAWPRLHCPTSVAPGHHAANAPCAAAGSLTTAEPRLDRAAGLTGEGKRPRGRRRRTAVPGGAGGKRSGRGGPRRRQLGYRIKSHTQMGRKNNKY
jgi:hypothetical protein